MRVAHLPSSEQNISASLEATSRHKGQMALPLTRPSYEGIKGQPLHHGTQDRRYRAAVPTVEVTGVPSADSGHRSAIPDVVAALWDLRRGTRQARYCSRYCFAYTDRPDSPPAGEGVRRRHVSFKEGRSAHTNGVLDLPPRGVQDLHVSPGPPSVHARTPTGGPGAATRPTAAGVCRTLVRRAHRTPPRRIWKTIHQPRPRRLQGHCRTTGTIFAGPRTKSRTTATHAAFPQCTSYSARPLYPAKIGRAHV